ncbi:MAG: hypothetical protein H5T41_02570 [Methanomassiliicoccales archaeon]|nr:hypothetical protein [Methanomassiliicoccales archaeon]
MLWDPGTNIGKLMREDLSVINATNAMVSAGVAAGTKSCTTSASQVAADQACVEVLCQADPDNTSDVLIGSATTQPVKLRPGQNIVIPCSNVNLLYAKSSAGTAVLNWLSRM